MSPSDPVLPDRKGTLVDMAVMLPWAATSALRPLRVELVMTRSRLRTERAVSLTSQVMLSMWIFRRRPSVGGMASRYRPFSARSMMFAPT